MGWHFTIHYEEGLLYVDRLFNQEFKKKKFQQVTYSFDTLNLPYERSGG
ncbi:hypothetical protein NSS79_25495 [Paenibacillus sp. FSL L8-0436]